MVVSWLPLYHDMGLIGCLGAPMTRALDLVLAAPQDFLASPGRWLAWMHEFGGTVSAGPNFSYALATRALRRMDPGTLDLSRWRIALNGAEPVDPETVDAFVEAAVPQGLDPRAVFAVFGMAEATLAVTFPGPFSGMDTDPVDREVLERERLAVPSLDPARIRRLPKLGRPVAGLSVRIVDPATGDEMGDREVGELEVSGTLGHARLLQPARRHQGLVPRRVAAHRGSRVSRRRGVGGVRPDQGHDHRGRPQRVPGGCRAGGGVGRGRPGRERHRLRGRRGNRGGRASSSSPRHANADVLTIRAAVADRVRDAVGLPPEVVLVTPGTLPKTSSGKLQRSLCRHRYLEEDRQLA